MTLTFGMAIGHSPNKSGQDNFMNDITLFKSLALNALEIWSNAANLIFVEVDSEAGQPQILFKLGQKKIFESPNFDIYGCAKKDPNGLSEILIDGDQNWASPYRDQPAEAGIDLLTILVHEIGHVLGLEHDEVNLGSVMFKSYNGKRKGLSERDIEVVCHEFGPVRSGFAIPNPANGPVTGHQTQFLAIGTDQYLFFSEQPPNHQGIRSLKALRSQSLRVWERLELPAFAKDNFACHQHLAQYQRQLWVTKQGSESANCRSSVLPISWNLPVFENENFVELPDLGLHFCQTTFFDSEMVVVGAGEKGLETWTIPPKTHAANFRESRSEWDFGAKRSWPKIKNDGQRFKLRATPDRLFLFKLGKNGHLTWRFNETSTSWSPIFSQPGLGKISVFDIAFFGDMAYLATIFTKNLAVVAVYKLKIEDSTNAKLVLEKNARPHCVELENMGSASLKSVALIVQKAKLALAVEDAEKIWFQEI